jgi:hypothetical protein
MTSRPTQWIADLRRGAVVGFGTGLIFTVWASLVFAQVGDGPFRATHTTFKRVILIYLAVGTVAGALIGSAWRLGRSTAACYLLAVPAASAVALGVILMNRKGWVPWEFETQSLFGVLVCIGTLVIGNQINVRRVARLQVARADNETTHMAV